MPVALGGAGGDARDATRAIAAVAEESLTAAFVLWGQRVFIDYLLASPNVALRERWVPDLLAGRIAGATGLSNAMKFLSGIEALQITATATDGSASQWTLQGKVPWVTNARPDRFIVAVAVARAAGGAPLIVALPHDRPGVTRSADLDLIALRGSNTASLQIADCVVSADDLIHAEAPAFIPGVRPAFLGMQCGMSIGVARASLAAAEAHLGSARAVLRAPLDAARRDVKEVADWLEAGLADNRFVGAPAELFRLRIRLAELAMSAVQLELQASGGRAYHRDQPYGFARRWREAAFVPIVTPSLTQLHGELQRHAARADAEKLLT